MKNAVPISLKKFDTFGVVYFNIDNFFDTESVDGAYLLLEVYGSTTGEEIQCYLNESLDGKLQSKMRVKRSNEYGNFYRKEVLLDITESYHLLASGIKINNGMIVEYGNNQLISCQLFFSYKKDIITPQFSCEPYFEKKLYISSRQKEAVTPYFSMATATMLTIWVENLGKHPISLSVINSPDAKKGITYPQWVEILPSEIVMLNPKYFTKYIRAIVKGAENGIIANVWFQSQLVR